MKEIELVIDLSEFTYLILEAMNRYPDKHIIKVGKLFTIQKQGKQLEIQEKENQ